MRINPYQSPSADSGGFDSQTRRNSFSWRRLRTLVAPLATIGGSLLTTAVQLTLWGRPTAHTLLDIFISVVVVGAGLGITAEICFPATIEE